MSKFLKMFVLLFVSGLSFSASAQSYGTYAYCSSTGTWLPPGAMCGQNNQVPNPAGQGNPCRTGFHVVGRLSNGSFQCAADRPIMECPPGTIPEGNRCRIVSQQYVAPPVERHHRHHHRERVEIDLGGFALEYRR